MTLIEYLDENKISYTMKDGCLIVGGSLHLEGSQITSLPDNLVVGGSLYIEGLLIKSLPDNLVVGGYLDIEGLPITSLPDNLIVGGWCCFNGTKIPEKEYEKVSRKFNPNLLSWRDGKIRKIDGVLCEVLSEKKNVLRVRIIGETKTSYIVTDGENYSHGKTVKEAKADLIYKISNRDKSKYDNLMPEDELTFEEAIKMYRVITGACEYGTKQFISSLGKTKSNYKVSEIIKLTEGQYGNEELREFLNKNRSYK